MDCYRANRARGTGLCALLVVFACQGTGVATAAPTSTISSPADGTFVFHSNQSPSPLPQIEGTATEMSKVDINCYYGDSANVRQQIARDVSVTGGRFSLQFPYLTYEAGHACVLRAVPEGDSGWYPPGDSVSYAGPRITESGASIDTYDPITHDRLITYSYGDTDTSFAARMTIRSAGGCGLGESLLFSPGQLTASARTFTCDGGLRAPPYEEAAPTGVTVDGISAFPPATVYGLNHEQPVASAPQVSVTHTFDPATAEVSIDEHDPLAICAERPSQPEGCESWVSAGVELERTWQTTNGNQLALMSDTWRSTDGRAHALAITYEIGTRQGPTGGGFQFPGQGSFAQFPAGLSTSIPTGPATFFYSENIATASGGDYVYPFLAISYTGSPSAYSEVQEEFESKGGELYYEPQLAPGGSFSVQMGFSQAYSLEGVRALAAQAEAAMLSKAPGSPVSGVGATDGASRPSAALPHGHLELLRAKSKGGKITISIGCGGGGASCSFDAMLTSSEKLRGHRIVDVTSARKSTHRRHVTIARVTRLLPAGARVNVTLAPNRLGRQLLARFLRLPVLLTVAELHGSERALRLRERLTVLPNATNHRSARPQRHGR